MGWLTGIVVYILTWWVVLFAILPLWVTPPSRAIRATPPARRSSPLWGANWR